METTTKQLCEGVTLEVQKLTNRDRIIEFMKGKDQVTVKEIQAGLPDIKPTVVWGCIASDKYKHFERVSRGVYRLRVLP